MRAIKKYKKASNQGHKEAQRRIAQSYGYRISLLDMPNMIGFLNRAGIELFNELPEGYSEGDTIKFT
tara:strand:- start:3628 stop:3828 length:201 start_codon:yes stop_codon:yes gene_type:complete